MFKNIFIFCFTIFCFGQEQIKFTKQDSLRGSITAERIWWDLQHYDLKLEVFPQKKYIKGKNTITYKVLKSQKILQIDLQKPLKIYKIIQRNKNLNFEKKGMIHYVHLQKIQKIGSIEKITIFFKGKPQINKNPPWSAGFTWEKDKNGKDFIATSCQGQGASVWWPCKEHMYDEPDKGMDMRITIPKNLMAVCNGRLKKVKKNKNTKTFHWQVVNPINNYGVNVNIGDYVRFSEKYKGLKGNLDCDYYVLKQDLKKAKKQFKQVPKMLKAFEYWFGAYPFYEDSYKLVQVPYLGMEHQSSVTYGNEFKNGYRGRDLSGTGWGLKFDYIIIHESGHEWFANNITYKDIADMWIHESFTMYSESIFLEYHYGKKAASAYLKGLRKSIRNKKQIIGFYNVNNEGSRDMYPKGANMLHTIRQIINNDKKWRAILRGLNTTFYHKTVTTKEIENFMIEKSEIPLQPIFDQYLRNPKIPKIIFKKNKKGNVLYRYENTIPNFKMPLKIKTKKNTIWIHPTEQWQMLSQKNYPKVDANFYITQINL